MPLPLLTPRLMLRSPRVQDGFAREAAQEVLRFAADEVGLRRLISVIHPDNLASLKLAERLGFVIERTDVLGGVPVMYYARDL